MPDTDTYAFRLAVVSLLVAVVWLLLLIFERLRPVSYAVPVYVPDDGERVVPIRPNMGAGEPAA